LRNFLWPESDKKIGSSDVTKGACKATKATSFFYKIRENFVVDEKNT
jgi:hypothetical protein